MLNTDFPINRVRVVRKNQPDVEWYSVPYSTMTMVQAKHYKFVRSQSFAVSEKKKKEKLVFPYGVQGVWINIWYSKLFFLAQPPGVPEICKRSLKTCVATGGQELFIIGKNFLKDTRVVFQARRASSDRDEYDVVWEEICLPDKEYLQQVSSV